MGLAEREYTRFGDEPGVQLRLPHSIVWRLILLNAAIYVVQVVCLKSQVPFTQWLTLPNDLWQQPWRFYSLLTSGFLHNPTSLMHVAFNMLALWFFGSPLEERLGRREFLTFYLTAVIASGLFWNVIAALASEGQTYAYGASGAISAVVILFAFCYPNRTVLLFFVLPVPAWVLGLFFVAGDAMGALDQVTGQGKQQIAYVVHLGGAAFAAAYFQFSWRLERWLPSGLSWPRRGPKLKIHRPQPAAPSLRDEEDRILRKIQLEGMDSLTTAERSTLDEASRRAARTTALRPFPFSLPPRNGRDASASNFAGTARRWWAGVHLAGIGLRLLAAAFATTTAPNPNRATGQTIAASAGWHAADSRRPSDARRVRSRPRGPSDPPGSGAGLLAGPPCRDESPVRKVRRGKRLSHHC